MSLLLKSHPLVVIPELAVRIGLNEAMLLQQIQYWLTETTSGVEYDGSRWIYNTIEEWKKQFPFFSESTIKRAFNSLKELGILRIEQINKSNHDRTNYYAINYGHQLLIEEVNMTPSSNDIQSNRVVQNDPIETGKLNSSSSSECTVLNRSKWPDLTETTTEITTENIINRENADEKKSQPSSKKTKSQKRAMPEDFAPTEKHQALASELGVSLQEEFLKFTDHHLSKGSVFADWGRALNTWLRNASEFKRGQQRNQTPPKTAVGGYIDCGNGLYIQDW